MHVQLKDTVSFPAGLEMHARSSNCYNNAKSNEFYELI
jgi:hypothetical protein